MFNATLKNLCVNFDNHFELKSINWKLNDSQHWVITGANGSGKSALAASLLGTGDIEFGVITGLPTNIAVVSFEAQAELIEQERRKDDADILDVITEGTSVQEMLDEGCKNKNEQQRLVEAFKFETLLSRSFRNYLLAKRAKSF